MTRVLERMIVVLGLIVALVCVAAHGWAQEGQTEPDPLALLEQALPEGVSLATATDEQIMEALVEAVAAHQELAAALVATAIQAAPDQAVALVVAAIQAAPEQAADILAAAVEAAPDQADAILTAAIEADPAAAGPAAAALARVLQLPNFPEVARQRAPVFRDNNVPSPVLP